MLHAWTTVYATLFFAMLILLMGVTCNAFLIFVIVRSPRLKGENHKLIANLGMSDLLQSCNMIVMVITLFNGGQWTLGEVLCKANAFLTTEFLLASMLTICVISVNRYLKIVKPRVYNRVFNGKSMHVILPLIWAFPLAFAVPPLLGWASYVFKPSKCICLVKSTYISSYGLALGFVTLGINMPVIFFCYFNVFKAVGVHTDRMEHHRSRSKRRDSCVNVEEIRITRTLVIVTAAYIICFIPITIIGIVQTFTHPNIIPEWVELISVMLVFANQALDPIIYGFSNTQYRRAMHKFTTKVIFRRTPSLTSTRANTSAAATRSPQGKYCVGSALFVMFLATEDEIMEQRIVPMRRRLSHITSKGLFQSR